MGNWRPTARKVKELGLTPDGLAPVSMILTALLSFLFVLETGTDCGSIYNIKAE